MDKFWFELEQMDFKNKDKAIIKANTSLVKLLNHGIIPINKDGLWHFDIKAGNIIIDANFKTRLIDWDSSLIVDSSLYSVISSVSERPIHFNLPLSIVFFDTEIHINNRLRNAFSLFADKIEKPQQVLMSVAEDIYKELKGQKDNTHFKFILGNMLPTLYGKNNYKNIIINYLYTVLDNYVDLSTKTFDEIKFLKEVFSKNADIYGFIITYSPILMIFNTTSFKERQFMRGLEQIIIKYCFSTTYAAQQIPYKNVASDLLRLNKILSGKVFKFAKASTMKTIRTKKSIKFGKTIKK
jgi:hypothetical protein